MISLAELAASAILESPEEVEFLLSLSPSELAGEGIIDDLHPNVRELYLYRLAK
jgi:hypothetical protein